MLFRGPGIAPGSTFDFLGTNVDVAVTWLGLAGLDRAETMDGRSIVPLLISANDTAVPAPTRAHIAKLAPAGRSPELSRYSVVSSTAAVVGNNLRRNSAC